jgi:hypothetical protein
LGFDNLLRYLALVLLLELAALFLIAQFASVELQPYLFIGVGVTILFFSLAPILVELYRPGTLVNMRATINGLEKENLSLQNERDQLRLQLNPLLSLSIRYDELSDEYEVIKQRYAELQVERDQLSAKAHGLETRRQNLVSIRNRIVGELGPAPLSRSDILNRLGDEVAEAEVMEVIGMLIADGIVEKDSLGYRYQLTSRQQT